MRVVASQSVGRGVQSSYADALHTLTPRQWDVLECLVNGLTHSELAEALKISTETARDHSAAVRRKVGVRTNRELIGMELPSRYRA